jgi:hypothetical protein
MLCLAPVVNGQNDPSLGVWMRLDFISGEDPDIIAEKLNENGVDAVFLLVPFPTGQEDLDRIRDLDSSLGPDIDLHLWLTIFRNDRYLSENPNESFVSTEPLSEAWVNPLSEKFREDLLGGIGQMVEEIGPEGIFLDYFYVPLGPFDDVTMNSFSNYMGRNLTMKNVTNSPDTLGIFFEWRNDAMIELLRSIRRETPGLNLSVFIIMLDEAQRLARGQDIARFSGFVDFIVPNTYHVMARRSASWVGEGVNALRASGAGDVWSGVQGYEISSRELRKAIGSALRAGAEGVIVFRYGTLTDEHWSSIRQALSTDIPLWALLGLPILAIALASIIWLRRSRQRAARKRERQVRKKKRRKR